MKAEIPAAGCIGPELRPCTAADVCREEIPERPLSVQAEAPVRADARARLGRRRAADLGRSSR